MLTVKDIIERYVRQISREIKIDSIVSLGDNLFKIVTCNTKWAMVGYFAQVRDIDPETNEFTYIDVEIKEVKLNEYFVIQHTESPQLGVRMCELHFRSGTILQTREEIKNDDNRNDPIKRTPMIFVREVAGEQWATKYNDSIERRTLEIPEIFFLAALKSKTETTNEAYEDVIYPMLNVVRLFERVLYNFKGEVSRFQTIDIEYHTKFAVQTRVGATEWVFDEALAGLQTQFNIALLKNFDTDCKCDDIDEPIPTASILLKVNTENFKVISESPYNITIRNSLGQSVGVIDPANNLVIVPDAVAEINGIEVLTIPSGNTLEIKVKQGGVEVGSLINGEWIIPACADASYRVQYVNGTLIEEGTIASGGSKTINVPNPSTCDPASYEVRDSDGNVLYSGTIASGGTENIVVTNSTVIVRKSDNTIISSVSVLAQGSANYQVADSVITLTDTSAATLSTTNVKATDPATIVAPNGTLNVNKSDGVLISGQTVKSGETKGYNVADSVVSNSDASYTANVKATDPLTLPDQQININGVDQGDIASVGTIDFNITDGVNPVLPNSVVITGRTVDIEVSTGGGSLTVDFSVDDATPDTNQTITFTDLTVGATAWVWNFGDGTSSSLQNPTKVYAHLGIYTVTLAATDGTSSGEEIKTSFITCSLQALPSANLQMHNSALIGASPSNATLVSGTISQWNDDINSYHRTQGTPANRPTYLYPAITAPNGIVYGAARFDGSSDFLQNNNAAFTRGTGSFEVLVLKRNAALGVGRVISESASAGNLFELFYVTNTRELGLFNGSIQNNIQSLQIGTWAILLVHWNQASSSINWNNKSIGNAAGTIGNNSAVGSTLGAAFNGGLAAQFDFLEHIIYTAKPSDSDIALIIQRIISQYGNIF